uniref:50S ribosomal protein L3 n=1 Tax=Clavibacter michiganensis TaxID=28447 RepID=UPI00292F3E07
PRTAGAIAPNVVPQVRTPEAHRCGANQIAYVLIDPRKADKPRTGHFDKAGVTPRRLLTEVRTADFAAYALGQEITVGAFEPGTNVDVVGTSKGKGGAGVTKRRNFKGVSASHGSHRAHRKSGSVAPACTT